MSCCNAFRANLPGGEKQLIELHMIVAQRARNRSAPFEVIVHERTNHILLELALEVNHVKRDAQMFRNAASIVNIVNRTTAMLRWLRRLKLRQAALIPKLHR